MRLLKQKGSGEIYVWTEQLAQRPDMEEFFRNPQPVAVTDQITDAVTAVAPVEEPVQEPVQQPEPAKRTRGYVKKALAAKAKEFADDDQVSGA